MRLERLVVEGFESAADKVEVDFTGKNLTVFIGENGSGKSLLSIWAPIFALYGKTRHRTLDKAIASSRGQALVELEFSANGGSYKVIRKLPRKGRNEATLYAKDKDGDWEAQTSKDVKTTDPKIIEVIGMDYDAAVATFIAQQGKYGLFNKSASEPRRKILTNLLNLNGCEESAHSADERYKALVVEAATHEAQLEEIAVVSVTCLRSATPNLKMSKRKNSTRFSKVLSRRKLVARNRKQANAGSKKTLSPSIS